MYQDLYPDTLHGDIALVRDVLTNDATAADCLLQRYCKLVSHIASRYLITAADREDLLGRLCERLWANDCRALREWQPQSRLSAYITVIATRICLNDIRSFTRNSPPVSLDDILDESFALDPGLLIEQKELGQVIQNVMPCLSPRDRIVLRLRFWEDADTSEIAHTLNITAGAARKAVCDALKRLKRILEANHPEIHKAGPSPRNKMMFLVLVIVMRC